jgi:hypothetical protein
VNKAKQFLKGNEFGFAKAGVEEAIKVYTSSMGYLTATMTVELLRQDRENNKHQILNWIWTGDTWKKHKFLHQKRVPGTGEWVLNSSEFKSWDSGDQSTSLICHGIRTCSHWK